MFTYLSLPQLTPILVGELEGLSGSLIVDCERTFFLFYRGNHKQLRKYGIIQWKRLFGCHLMDELTRYSPM